MGVESTVSPDPGSGAIVVTLRGELTLESVPAVRSVLLKCFSEFPEAVIVDLGELHTDTRAHLTVFPAVVRIQPTPVSLVLCCVSTRMSALMRGTRFADVTVYDTRERALSAVRTAQVFPARRESMHLLASPSAPATARQLVDRACRAWRVEHLAGPATVVISELVSNAVQHAGTDLDVVVRLRGAYLHLGVHDDSPELPLLTELDAFSAPLLPARGRGLHLVAGYATAWVCSRTNGGKTVWATFRVTR